MLELAFNLSNDPLFYIVTLTLLINLSGITAWVFLYRHHEVSVFQHTKWLNEKLSVCTSGHQDGLVFGQLTHWISKFIRRKESPQDDSDDHVSLFVLAS